MEILSKRLLLRDFIVKGLYFQGMTALINFHSTDMSRMKPESFVFHEQEGMIFDEEVLKKNKEWPPRIKIEDTN